MLKEIKTKEIMTTRAAMKKYRTQYFMMVITEIVDRGDNDLGYVIYTADKEKELTEADIDKYGDIRIGLMLGDAAEPFPCVGNVVYHE